MREQRFLSQMTGPFPHLAAQARDYHPAPHPLSTTAAALVPLAVTVLRVHVLIFANDEHTAAALGNGRGVPRTLHLTAIAQIPMDLINACNSKEIEKRSRSESSGQLLGKNMDQLQTGSALYHAALCHHLRQPNELIRWHKKSQPDP